MIFLRVLLYLVCIVSIGWSALVFAGPVFVKRVITGYTDGALVASDIVISPSLDIKISRLDFTTLNENFAIPIEGFLRAAEISWSFFGEKPFLSFTSGPSVLKDYLSADHMHIFTPSFREIDWQNLMLTARIERLNQNSIWQAEAVTMRGNLNFYSLEPFDVEVDVQSIRANRDGSAYEAKLLSGQITDLNFEIPLNEQLYSGTFLFEDIMVSEPSLRSEFATVNISTFSNAQNFEIDLQNLKFPEIGGSLNNLKIHGNYDRDYNLNNLNLFLSGGAFSPPSFPNFPDISTKILRTGTDTYETRIEGYLSEFEMSNSESFFGVLPPSNFEIFLQSDEEKSTLISEGKVNFKNLETENINGSASLLFSSGIFRFLGCIFVGCELPQFDASYKLEINDDWIKGRAECLDGSCELIDLNHKIRLSDTVSIFSSLNQAGILSPISSIYLYGLLSSGKKIDKGHELKF